MHLFATVKQMDDEKNANVLWWQMLLTDALITESSPPESLCSLCKPINTVHKVSRTKVSLVIQEKNRNSCLMV